MSDVMLMGVLRMPIECWGDSVIDKAQRYGRYNEAAYLIEQLQDDKAELLDALQFIVNSLVDSDEEGLIEHTEQIIKARAAIAKTIGYQSHV